MSSDRPMSGTAEPAHITAARDLVKPCPETGVRCRFASVGNGWECPDCGRELRQVTPAAALDALEYVSAALVALVERAEGGARDTARIDKLAQFDEVEVLRIDEYPQSWSRGALVAPELRLRTFIDRIRPPAASRPLPTGERRG